MGGRIAERFLQFLELLDLTFLVLGVIVRAGSWKDHTVVCFVYQMPMPTVSVDMLILLLSLGLNKVRQTLRVLRPCWSWCQVRLTMMWASWLRGGAKWDVIGQIL